MTDIIKFELNNLSKIANLSFELINGAKFGNTEKQTLFLSYFDMNEEHLRAIQLLFTNNCNGSAFALVRTFYETFFRALWMNAYASLEEVEKIRNDNFNFTKDNGTMSSKIDKLDEYYTGTTFFKDLKNGAWGIMSDFTHSGSKQLARRWKEDKLEPNYTDNEILEVITEITKTHLWFTDILLRIHGYQEKSNKVFNIYTQYKKDTDSILNNIYIDYESTK